MATEIPALDQPLSEGGIRTVNFFNGRLLTGEDLGREQEARRQADARVGLAVGEGVVSGLGVFFAGKPAGAGGPALVVKAGVAVARDGRILSLAGDVTVALTRRGSAGSEAVGCLFADCVGSSRGSVVSGHGLYLLSIGPAFVSEGRARSSGFEGGEVRCNTDATVEAVRFRLTEIEPRHLAADPAARAAFSPGAADYRNRIAYRAFGQGVLPDWPADIASAAPRRDELIEAMGTALPASDVPLALLAFRSGFDHVFTDMWSVRRPVGRGEPGSGPAACSDPGRLRIGAAMHRQFLDHYAAEATSAAAQSSGWGRSAFRWLPPAGIVPAMTDEQARRFFAGMNVREPIFIGAAAVEPLIRESFSAPAIDTSRDELVWMYRIAPPLPQGRAPALVFASGWLPYLGDARFERDRYDQSNYALTSGV